MTRDYAIVVDKASTFDSFGRTWAPKGQNGNTAAGVNDDGTFRAPINLVSMYRVDALIGIGEATVYKDSTKFR